MFFIHGGGFIDGSGRDYAYGPDHLLENDVILVTINYRLSLFGFFSLEMPEYCGNMGLMDQQLALKWVYDNIERFGGDSDCITIFGQSAGMLDEHSIACDLITKRLDDFFHLFEFCLSDIFIQVAHQSTIIFCQQSLRNISIEQS